jgi:hypothetical protein
VDGDFFAAPVVRPQTASAVTAPVAQQARRTSAGGPWLLWTIVAAVLLAGAASMVAMMGGLAHHDSKALDSRSLAYDATTKSDLAQTAAKEQAYFAENGQYGGAQEIGASVLPGATGTQITVMYEPSSFCLQGAHLGTANVFYYSSAAGLLPLGQTCS